jgi:predicted nucleic acid-binding protein
LKNLKNGQQYITAFYDLIASEKISILTPNETLTQDAYRIAKQNNITTYDAIFISVALQYELSMKTLDKAQNHTFKSESDKLKK